MSNLAILAVVSLLFSNNIWGVIGFVIGVVTSLVVFFLAHRPQE